MREAGDGDDPQDDPPSKAEPEVKPEAKPEAAGEAERPDVPAGDANHAAIPVEATVPPTRRQTAPALADAAPPDRPAGSILQFPDDGLISAWFRHADQVLGTAEQVVLFVLLGAVVLTAASAALSDRVFGIRFGRWWFDIVRGGTFSVAMIGAVFASHQQRHLAMDLVSRRLPPRGRLVLRVILALFTMFVAGLLVRSGLHQLDTVGEEGGEHLISTHSIVAFMPVGAALIIVHTFLHLVIDLDYLVRDKTPPARMRSGH